MTHAVCVLTKFCSWNPKCKGKFLRKKNVKKDKIRLHFFPWKDTRHTTHSLLLLLKNVFFCCSNCYSIRSLERDSFQERRHPQVVLFVRVLCLLIDHPREWIILFFFISSFRDASFFPQTDAVARARETGRRLHPSRHETPPAVKASFVPSFRRKESKRVKYILFREIYNWKDWGRDIAVLNFPRSVNTFLLQKRTRQHPHLHEEDKNNTHCSKRRKREQKKFGSFYRGVFFTLMYSLYCALSFVIFFLIDLAATSPRHREMIRKRSKRPSRANRTGTPTKVPAKKNSRQRRRRLRPRRRRTRPTPEEPPPRRRCKPKEKKPATKGPSSNYFSFAS